MRRLRQGEKNLKTRLTMHETTSRDGKVAQYQVGTPATAFIRKAGSRYEPIWQILRVKVDGALDSAEGNYKSPEEALATLQQESDSG